MKKKKLSLKGLEVKSFVTNLDGNLSKTVKGGDSLDNNCGGSGVPGCDGNNTMHGGCPSYINVCADSDYAATVCWNSVDFCPPSHPAYCSIRGCEGGTTGVG